MASYWVSQERYFCKYCKVWLSNHKASIRNHDQGKKHVEIVAEFFRKKREDKLKGAQSESDLKRQMDRIEKAAQRAHEKDLAMFGGGGSGSSAGAGAGASAAAAVPPPPPPPGGPPPPPPPPPGGPPSAQDASELMERPPPPPPPGAPPGKGSSCGSGAAPPPPPPPSSNEQHMPYPVAAKKEEAEEGGLRGAAGGGSGEAAWDGVFEEGGQWYLHGQVHQEKLVVDTPCQFFLAAEGLWVDAMVLAVEPLPPPPPPPHDGSDGGAAASAGEGSVASSRRLELAYFEAGAEKETVLSGVEASTVRLPAGEGGAWPPPQDVPPPPPPPPDENTGLGGWQTVSVRMVDVAAEAEARRVKKEVKKEKKLKKEEKTERELLLVEAMDADDAMGSYDPWGTGKYKGFEIAQDVPRGPEEEAAGAAAEGRGAAVSFKKRKGPGNKGKFRKKARDDDA